MNKKQKQKLYRLIISFILFICAIFFPDAIFGRWSFAIFVIPYLTVGYDILLKAAKNIGRRQIFDENFLMSIASLGAFGIGEYPEAVAVMLFYQTGELFQSCAIDRSRRSIAALMDIRPEFANVERNSTLFKLDPEEVMLDEIIVVKPGERVPLDGIVLEGISQLDTAALSGESLPRTIEKGEEIFSGSINLTGLLRIKVTKIYGESTVSRILELVEDAAEKKSQTENFITRFARYYTPAVVIVAALLMLIPPLFFNQPWSNWIERGLIFLVVSCPCALVISVPMAFFGGIGGASKNGILVKGGNYLDALSKVKTIVFDKTGTLTSGNFSIAAINPQDVSEEYLLKLAAGAETYSNHPVALCLKQGYNDTINKDLIHDVKEITGQGVSVLFNNSRVLAGNTKLMQANNIAFIEEGSIQGTAIHIAKDGNYAGNIVIADTLKDDAESTLSQLRKLGIEKTVMLSGDKESVAKDIAQKVGIDEYYAELMPEDKVTITEKLISENNRGKLAFVGDGINDAPALTRADVGIAMGAMGSDAAIEAADIVLMDDNPKKIVMAIRIANKTIKIVWQNIVLALGVKGLVLLLGALGIANMWHAVFADVGVAVIAILNAMRTLVYKGI